MNSNNVKYLFLGKNLAPLTSGVADLTTLTDGQIAVINPATGVAYAHGGGHTSATELQIAIRNGNSLIKSPVFKGANVTKGVLKAFVEDVEQVTFVGYNGTSAGAIEVINDNTYNIRNLLIGADQVSMGQQKMVYGMYKSATTDTQSNIAYELASNLAKNSNGMAVAPFIVGRTYSGAQTLIENSAATMANWTVTKGSRYITSIGGNHGISTVGTIINLAGLAFIVTEITSATVLQLDLPWQHPSGTCLASDLSTGAVTIDTNPNTSTIMLSAAHGVAAGSVVYLGIANNGATAATAQFYSGVAGGTTPTNDIILDNIFRGTANNACVLAGGTCAAGGNWGIRIQGAKRPFTSPRVSKFSKVRFDTTIENFGTTVVYKTVGASEGLGNWEQVSELEWFCQGFEGLEYKKHHLELIRSEVLTSGKYDIFNIDFYNPSGPYALGDTKNMPEQIIIAMDNASGVATSAGITHTNTNLLAVILDDAISTITSL